MTTTLVTSMIYIIIITVIMAMMYVYAFYKTVKVMQSNEALEGTLAELREKNNAN